MTRHTPRDLLRLFEEIRKIEASGIYGDSDGASELSQEVIREGVLQYATKYFVGAINNEFAGYEGGPEAAAAALAALKAINKQKFDANEFRKALGTVSKQTEFDADDLLRLLFFAGAIGNFVGGVKDKSYMQFYHRREESEIYLKGAFILHNAVIHAWRMRRTLSGPAQPTDADPHEDVKPARPGRKRTRGGRSTAS